MSSKFLTWTKGDRIGEALRSDKVKGLDHSRTEKGSSKARRRPPPLIFNGSPTPSPKHSSRTNNSIALQDAAVKSATSLISVMNDMLRSPHLSAHLTSSYNYSTDSTVGHYRPRAYTAPTTPLAEISTMDAVELPGSLPQESRAYLSPDQFYTGDRPIFKNQLGEKIERPRSSPQETAYGTPSRRARMSIESFYRDASLAPPLELSPGLMGGDQYGRFEPLLPSYREEESLPPSDKEETAKVLKRPPLTVLPIPPPKSSGLSTPLPTSQPCSMHTVPQLGPLQRDVSVSQGNNLGHQDTEAIFLEQMSNLRESHDSHVHSLKEAHEKEVAVHRSYILFLERRQRTKAADDPHKPVIETARLDAAGPELQNMDNSTVTTQSSESIGNKSCTSLENVESIKRKLSLYRRAQADAAEVRRERDQLREAADRGDRRISQLKGIVRKTKDNERALKSAVANLEARLIAANNERTDVLEGFHEASEKLQSLSRREQGLVQEIKYLRSRETFSNPTTAAGGLASPDKRSTWLDPHRRTFSDIGPASIKFDTLSQQVNDLQLIVANKDARIRELEEAKCNTTTLEAEEGIFATSLQSTRILELQEEIETYKESLATAQADSERYNSLLHNELRRQIRYTVEKDDIPYQKIDAEALNLAKNKIEKLKADTESATWSASADINATDLRSSSFVEALEHEITHCIKEIVLYKLDVKGYKKDLKNAKAKIERLEATGDFSASTSNTKSSLDVVSDVNIDCHRGQCSEPTEQSVACANPRQRGLGISAPEISKDSSKVAQIIAPPSRSSAVSSPPVLRPKPSLRIHKKLPKPPSLSTPASLPPLDSSHNKTPPPSTLRSFSESIIVSHSKTISPTLEDSSTTPIRNPIITPMRSSDSPLVPLSKFASRQSTELLTASSSS